MNMVNEGVLPPDEMDDRDERREEQESRETVADRLASEPRSWAECVACAMIAREVRGELY